MDWRNIRPLRPRGAIERERILNIPFKKEPTRQERHQIQLDNVSVTGYHKGIRLLEAQVEALYAWDLYERGFFSIAVGEGKTLISILIASHYHEKNPDHSIILFMPAAVYKQLWVQDIPWARRNFNVLVPFVGLGQRDLRQRTLLTFKKLPKCFLFPYSLLSTLDTMDMLMGIDADLIIADEAHYLKESKSAKSKRFWHWLTTRETTPKGVVMSGTLTSKSPMDYYRLMKWTLGEYNPLPNVAHVAEEWSEILGADNTQLTFPEIRTMRPLTQWANDHEGIPTLKVVRNAYRKRLYSCPGFVSSSGDLIGTSIRIENLEARTEGKDFDALMLNMKEVEDDWITPSGDYLACALDKQRVLRELSTGFYHRLYWPDHPLSPKAKECWEVKQLYIKQLAKWYASWRIPRKGLDTPLAVGLDMAQNGGKNVPPEVYRLWCEWKNLDNPKFPERLSEPIRLCNYKIEKAVHWTRDKTGGILWHHNTAIGDWLEEALRVEGVPTLRKKAGSTWLKDDGSEEFFCVASIKAHGVGKNLPHHTNQLIVQWPPPPMGRRTEQLLGRVHRKGQKAEEIIVHTLNTTPFDHEVLSVTLKQTIYAIDSLTRRAKLLIADWSPLPKDYPEELLRRKGWDI